MSQSSSFRTSEIRKGMDVFSFDDVRIGTILGVIPGPIEDESAEEEISGVPDRRTFDGEATGPAPTRSVGNFGPATQSPENSYGTRIRSGESLGRGYILVGTFYGFFGRRRISLENVQTVSMERVVLRHRSSVYP